MKTGYNEFLIDVLNIVPDEVDFFIQAPSLENLTIQSMMLNSEYDYYKLIKLDKEKKKNFIEQEITNSVGAYIQNAQIKKGVNLLFEGFDGFEFGTLSRLVTIPEWFKKKYSTDTCMVSNEW